MGCSQSLGRSASSGVLREQQGLDDLRLQVHLAPPVQEKHAATAFERFRGWLVSRLRPKWPAAVVVRMDRDKPAGHHWTSDLRRLQLGGTRAPDPFSSVPFTIFATTQQRFVLRGKARVLREDGAKLFPTAPAQASPAITLCPVMMSDAYAGL